MNRRTMLRGAASAVAAGFAGIKGAHAQAAQAPSPNAVLGQGSFRYRAVADWGRLDPAQVPVKDCHAITENREGQIVLLTNDVRNNIITYTKAGALVAKREDRFPAAHALEFDERGGERLWITDHQLSVISLLTPDGREEKRLNPDALSAKYPDITKYHATNVAVMKDGDFFISDGYGSHYIHHFDPSWKYIATFGGAGTAPENLKQPHAIWLDTRGGKDELLVCDRANALLKWFSPKGELLRTVAVPGSQPSNIAPMANGHIAIASLNAMILILDKANKVVSVIGGDAPVYQDGVLQKLAPSADTPFIHPHDVYVDRAGAIYVAQWNSNKTYPLKFEPIKG
jgi:peptidylamidoglycolate lyase